MNTSNFTPFWKQHPHLVRLMCVWYLLISPIWIFRAIYATLDVEIKEVVRAYFAEAFDGAFGRRE